MTHQSDTSHRQQPSFLRRFWRALVRTLLTLAILAGVSTAGWLGFQELRRSFNAVGSRIDRNADRFSQLQEQINDQNGRLDSVEQMITDHDASLTDLEIALRDDITQQEETLTLLNDQIDSLLNKTQTISNTISLIRAGQTAIHEDVISHTQELDRLGGEVDNVQGELTAVQTNETTLSQSVATFETQLENANLANLQQAVVAFRLWELITRARLRLAEQNFGLAADDIALAQLALADLQTISNEETAASLDTMRQRLQMAAENVPSAPETAIVDLDVVWQELDILLSSLLLAPDTELETSEP